MVRQFGLIAGLAALISIAAPSISMAETPTPGVEYKQEFKFFTVYGKTSRQVFREFQRKSPIKAKGKTDATLGVAAIRLTPKVSYLKNEGRCKVKDVSVEADVVIHLPKWANYNSADRIAKLGWDVLFEDIKRHELQHAAIARDYAGRIQEKIARLRPKRDCKSLELSTNKAALKLLAKHDKAQRKFDRKEYRRLLKRRR